MLLEVLRVDAAIYPTPPSMNEKKIPPNTLIFPPLPSIRKRKLNSSIGIAVYRPCFNSEVRSSSIPGMLNVDESELFILLRPWYMFFLIFLASTLSSFIDSSFSSIAIDLSYLESCDVLVCVS